MQLFRIVYKIPSDNTQEFTAGLISTSPESIREFLTQRFGELTMFKCEGRQDIHGITPECEKSVFLKVQREIENDDANGK